LTKLEKYATIITKEIIQDEMGVPEPFNNILLAAVVWFVCYLPSKIIYSILNICYGKSEGGQVQAADKKDD
jgi:hypothetical protein